MYLSDKKRTELCFVASMVLTLITGGVTSDSDTLQKTAVDAVNDTLEGMPKAKHIKFINRTWRMLEKTMKASENESGEKIMFSVYHFIESLITSGYLEMPEDSNLARVVDFLLELPDYEKEYTQARLKKAEKTSQKWLDVLQKEGYFI